MRQKTWKTCWNSKNVCFLCSWNDELMNSLINALIDAALTVSLFTDGWNNFELVWNETWQKFQQKERSFTSFLHSFESKWNSLELQLRFISFIPPWYVRHQQFICSLQRWTHAMIYRYMHELLSAHVSSADECSTRRYFICFSFIVTHSSVE